MITQALEVARSSATEARALLLDYFGKLSQISHKAQAGLVSEADVESEKLITAKIKAAFPDHHVLGEEASYLAGNDFSKIPSDKPVWVIDPLDGTTNYVHRFPIFCISIGLWYQGRVQMGLIDVPVLEDTYEATLGGGSRKNGKSIVVSDRAEISQALLATGFFTENRPALKEQLRIFSKLVPQARGVRRAGAAAYDLCMVAEGVFDAFWEKNLQPWDTAAGSLIVQEAGGKVSTYEGETFDIFRPSIVAANPHLHALVQSQIFEACR